MKLQKILWASDGSKESYQALEYTVFLAKKLGSEILGIYISEMHITSMFFYPDYGNLLYDLMEKKIKENKEKFNSISKELRTKGIKFEGKIIKGEADKDIVQTAVSESADIIVLGKRGFGLIGRMLIGSTTLKVLGNSKIPVLAAKQRDEKKEPEIKNILVPIDISEKSESALNYAIDLAVQLNSGITALYVFCIDSHVYDIPPNLVDELINHSSDELSGRVEKIKQKWSAGNKDVSKLQFSTQVLHGASPAITISRYAERKRFDLIIINTHGRKGIKKFLLGSVTEKVVQESPCPVLVLRP